MQAISPKVFKDPRMEARRMFQRVLSGWAMDVLALRRRGWDRPCERAIEPALGLTTADRSRTDAPAEALAS